MLIIFAGLPGTGKSTIARELARRISAVYLRIDTIEQAIRDSGSMIGADVGPAGYIAAYRIAADNLRLARTVVADSVNPLKITRDAFRGVAEQAGAACLEVEIICSDTEIHRDRLRMRRTDVEGLVPPTWEDVQARHYEAWDRPHLVLDTASLAITQGVESVLAALETGRFP